MACYHSCNYHEAALLTQREKINYLRMQGWNQDEEKHCCLKFCRTSKKIRTVGLHKTLFFQKRRKSLSSETARGPHSPSTPQPASLRACPRFQAQLHWCRLTPTSAGQMLTSQPPKKKITRCFMLQQGTQCPFLAHTISNFSLDICIYTF